MFEGISYVIEQGGESVLGYAWKSRYQVPSVKLMPWFEAWRAKEQKACISYFSK